MSTLVVRRKKHAWQDRMRDYAVLVNGKKVASVSNGSDADITVKPGKHRVQLKIDWCGSPPIDLEVGDGQTVVVECGPNSHPLLALLYITFWKGKYIWLRNAA